jgi:5-methylcytosine-specific restriction endonuclease McrA
MWSGRGRIDLEGEKSMKKIDYRNQALKILPWVCAKCGRDFTGRNLRELTVHHKDHNSANNPPDGSNWELLCIYCHDNEHSRHMDAEWLPTRNTDREKTPLSTHTPFADLLKGLRRPGDKEEAETDE